MRGSDQENLLQRPQMEPLLLQQVSSLMTKIDMPWSAAKTAAE